MTSEPDAIPNVCFIQDVARALRCSTRSIYRRLAVQTFPIPPLPSIDSRLRWSGEDVRQFIAHAPTGRLRRVG
jgi:predicted DNA-binding transcriptional regulator AlpA